MHTKKNKTQRSNRCLKKKETEQGERYSETNKKYANKSEHKMC